MLFFNVNSAFGDYSLRFRGGTLVKVGVKKTPIEELLGFLIKSGFKRRAKSIISEIVYVFFKKRFLPEVSVFYFNLFWERQVLSKVAPVFDLKKKKSGPKILHIPIPIRIKKSRLFAYKWFFSSLFSRKEGTIIERFVIEVVSIVTMENYYFFNKNSRGLRNKSKTLDLCKEWHAQGFENIALLNRFNLPGKLRFRKRKRSKRRSRRMKIFLPELF